jgi:hypothetical protein
MRKRLRHRPVTLKSFSRYYASSWEAFTMRVDESASLDELAEILGARREIAGHARTWYLRLKGEADVNGKSGNSRSEQG